MRPQPLPPNVLRHFYAGGPRIAALRGLDDVGDHMPEEWLAAVNTTFGARDERGLSRLADGTLLREAIAADPVAWLGEAHVARFGDDPALLTKLLDAGQRLPVHFHPGRALAAEQLGLSHGKTEAWLIVEAEPDAAVWVGFKESVPAETVRGWMRAQDGAAMLAAMQELPVAAGDAIFVPAGTPHAIGAGILLVELQEPTDLSVCLEWEPFELTEEQAHLGLGWDVALPALDVGGWDVAGMAESCTPATSGNCLPPAANPYFRAERVRGGDELDAGFAVLVGLEGEGTVGEIDFRRGSVLLVPYAAGPLRLRGDVAGLRCRPPDPAAPEGRW
jgi:mannose-6-phosphate isomerase